MTDWQPQRTRLEIPEGKGIRCQECRVEVTGAVIFEEGRTFRDPDYPIEFKEADRVLTYELSCGHTKGVFWSEGQNDGR